jgi:predicted outer membrane repeat protein
MGTNVLFLEFQLETYLTDLKLFLLFLIYIYGFCEFTHTFSLCLYKLVSVFYVRSIIKEVKKDMKNNENSKNLIKLCLLLLGIGIIFSFGFNTVSAANTSNIYVNNQGNDNWNGLNSTWIKGTLNGPKATIKNATATVTTGGTIYIANGTYYENNIQINNDMTIIGASQTNTIINGGKQAGKPGVIFLIPSGVNVTIQDLTIENGYNEDKGLSGYGGAINNNGALTVNAITFTANTALLEGGAIYNTGNLNVNKCTFIKNSASLLGGAISNTGNLIVSNSNFNDNTIIKGAGGAIGNTGQLTLNNNNLFNNNFANNGGALFNANKLTINKNNTFTDNNAASNGGAIYNSIFQLDGQSFVGSATIESNTFKNNTASFGGAIDNDGGLVTVKTSIFTDNTASNGDGGAIYSASNLILTSDTFFRNTASKGNGGALAYNALSSTKSTDPVKPAEPANPKDPAKPIDPVKVAAKATAVPMTVVINSATAKKASNDIMGVSVNGCNFINNIAENGGAIFSGGNLTLKNCTFTNNTAFKGVGGALAFAPDLRSEPAEAAKSVEAVKSVAEPTIATKAVEIYAKSAPAAPVTLVSPFNANIMSCTFTNNTAFIGGAIDNEGNMIVTDSKFITNMANYGGAIFSDNNLTVTNCDFEYNNASNGNGGAIFNGPHQKDTSVTAMALLNAELSESKTNNGPYLTIDESSFVGNSAINGDGGAISNSGDANINFSRIIGNIAINGSAIYNSGDLMDATLNWWGSNMDPSGNVYGNVTVTPWLILKIIANPNIIVDDGANVTAVLLYDSYGVYHDPAQGKLQNGIPVIFTGSDGNFNPTTGILVDGQAISLFTAYAEAKTIVSTTIDDQTVSLTMIADPQPTNTTITTNSNNTITTNTKSINKTTIPMQRTGVPIAGLILSILTVIGGTIMSKKR